MPNRSTLGPQIFAASATEVDLFIWSTYCWSPLTATKVRISGSWEFMSLVGLPVKAESGSLLAGLHPIRPRPPVPAASGSHLDSPHMAATAPAAAIQVK